jgi:DNA-binding GntR family transcriptional regulator
LRKRRRLVLIRDESRDPDQPLDARFLGAAQPGDRGLARIAARGNVGEDVAEMLRQALLAGRFGFGERMVLTRLAEDLDVSVMPVREALITLASEGLVENEPRKGFRALPLTVTDRKDVFDIHAFLSARLAGRAAQVVTPEQIEELRSIHLRLVELAGQQPDDHSSARLDAINESFHRRLNTIGSGRMLRWFLRSTSKLVPHESYINVSGWLQASLRDHPKIIAALGDRDSESAEFLVRRHLAQGAVLLAAKDTEENR